MILERFFGCVDKLFSNVSCFDKFFFTSVFGSMVFSVRTFSLRNPGIVTIPASFLVGIVVSLMTRDDDSVTKWDAAVHKSVMG